MAKYKDIRHKFKSGDIVAWTHRGWKTWADIETQMVRFFTQSEYSHVGILWRVGNRVFVIEAVTPRVQILPLSLAGDFYHIPMDKYLSQEALDFALSQIGEPYSKMEAIRAYFNQVTTQDNNEWQCSKLVNAILEKNGTNYWGAMTPSEIVQAALEDGKSLQFISNPK